MPQKNEDEFDESIVDELDDEEDEFQKDFHVLEDQFLREGKSEIIK